MALKVILAPPDSEAKNLSVTRLGKLKYWLGDFDWLRVALSPTSENSLKFYFRMRAHRGAIVVYIVVRVLVALQKR